MKHWLFLSIFFFFYLGLRSELAIGHGTINDYVAEGVMQYQHNNFEQALDNFLYAEKSGLINPDLYFNLGNTYFSLNNLPFAILYYKKALLLDSSYSFAKKNLNFVLSLTPDKQTALDDYFLSSFLKKTFYFFSINSLLIFCLLLLTIIVIIIHAQWKFSQLDKTATKFAIFTLLFCFVFLVVITGARISSMKNNNEAVLIDKTVYAYSGPSESFTRLFTIHEGSVLAIHRQEEDWSQISTLNGFSGWIKTETFLRVRE